MTPRDGKGMKITFEEEEEAGLLVWCGSPVRTYWLKKNNWQWRTRHPFDRSAQDITATSEVDTFS